MYKQDRIIGTLTDIEKKVLYLKDIGKLTYRQISEELSLSWDSVQGAYKRASWNANKSYDEHWTVGLTVRAANTLQSHFGGFEAEETRTTIAKKLRECLEDTPIRRIFGVKTVPVIEAWLSESS